MRMGGGGTVASPLKMVRAKTQWTRGEPLGNESTAARTVEAVKVAEGSTEEWGRDGGEV